VKSAERAYNGRVAGERGSDLSDLGRDSIIDVVGYHLVPMYREISPTAAAPLLVLFLLGILRMLLDIVIRAITIARVCGCRCWLMGAFLGTLFQVAVVPMQWAVAKGTLLAGRSHTRWRLKLPASIGTEAEPGRPRETDCPQGTAQQPGSPLELV
jgi:hypothetical protein